VLRGPGNAGWGVMEKGMNWIHTDASCVHCEYPSIFSPFANVYIGNTTEPQSPLSVMLSSLTDALH
jgi:hypothetical protein